MRRNGERLRLSATDLSNFLGCRHRTALDMAVERGALTRQRREDPLLDLLIARGLEHERRYLEHLRAKGRAVVPLEGHVDDLIAPTLEAMQGGADVIAQGVLTEGPWLGRPDLLLRVPVPSALGDWSYEIADTKLSTETRGGTILQLGLYSAMLAGIQDRRPERFLVVTPGPEPVERWYRVDDFAAYVRLIRRQLDAFTAVDEQVAAAMHYPEPVEHCSICPYVRRCDARWHEDDHLSLVANITRTQRRELESRGVATMTALAELTPPLPFTPARGSAESYLRALAQARVQVASRGRTPPIIELREVEPPLGLCRLPPPSPGDVFLDLEGDALAIEGGREYLFGVVTIDERGTPRYRAFWGLTESDERRAFEAVIDLIVESWAADPGMHIYHYAPYEPSALKRLMGRYVTREEELDRLLRAERFVDLYAVVRQAMHVGIERYSIKDLEPLYAFERGVALDDAGRARRLMELALGRGETDSIPAPIGEAVEVYNRDDCLSTLELRQWLERVRTETEANGTVVPRPERKEGEPPGPVSERAARVADLRERLLREVPDDPSAREGDPELRARWLLAYLLDWHNREEKAGWWEYYRLTELPEEDLIDEPRAVAGLELVERLGFRPHKTTGRPTRTVRDRYRYPPQEMEIGRGDRLRLQNEMALGKVIGVDRERRTIDVEKGPRQADVHPTAAFAFQHFDSDAMEGALAELAEAVLRDGRVDARRGEVARPARDLLLATPPRLGGAPFRCADDASVEFAVQTVLDLDESVLPIQGPPGSGKTYCAARMICALVARGKRVGITANSHKVILNLLEAVDRAAQRNGVGVRLAHKAGEDADPAAASITLLPENGDALEMLMTGDCNVLGGTAWMWARPEFAARVDVLFIDEAGQMSLANALAVSRAARNLVLLGDPRQLDQPRKGSHPEGVDVSALDHVLGEHLTMPPERGIFFPVTWRLAPGICVFTSEMFYEGKLHSRAELEGQRLFGSGLIDGAGLWLVDVPHDGNRNHAAEEIEIVARLVARLTAPGVRWTDGSGETRPITMDDILIVAPYNAQVSRLLERLGAAARVGTVDKFQGQEAPVVIYSMATSRPEDAPRGMEFLYSVNRLNVATSRARCAVVLVANPSLYEPECRTPRQMQLANALCRYRELASVVPFGEEQAEGPGDGYPAARSPNALRASSSSVQYGGG